MIRLRTLGTVDLRDSTGIEIRPVLAQTRRLALLVYLAAARPRGFHRRDKLFALFWPDHATERARAALNGAVYFLRREIGHGVLSSRNDEEIGLDSEQFWCDAEVFDDAAANLRCGEALELYQGDFLPGFFVPEAPAFEEWLESERARLRERASVTAWTLADEEEKAGNLVQAAQRARQAVRLSPFREVALRRLLALLDRAGDRVGAGLAYQQFEREIADEAELSPSPETRALIRAIQTRDTAHRVRDAAGTNDREEKVARDPVTLVPPSLTTAMRARRRGWLPIIAAAAVLTVSTVGGLLIWRTRPDPARVYLAPIQTSGDHAVVELGRLTADRIIQALASTGLVQVVTPDADGLGRSPSKGTAAGWNFLARLAATRAGSVVSVDLQREAGRIHVQARITDTRRHRVWAVRPISAPADSAERAIEEAVQRVAGAAVALTMSRFASWFPIASLPPTFTAFQEFAHADELQARGGDREALDHLQRAVLLDSTFKWAELQLAAAWLNLFEDKHADPLRDELDRERDLLNPLQRAWLDWMLAMKVEDQPARYRAISSAARLAPERFLYEVAWSAAGLNRPLEAKHVLERLGANSPYNGGTTSYWRWLTRSHHGLGDYTGELAAARRARQYPMAPITAMSFECIALAAMGRLRQVRLLVDTALTLQTDRGTSPRQLMAESGTSPAQLMILCAEELRAHGFEDAAMELVARALEWYRAQPASAMLDPTRRFDVATAFYDARDWPAAEAAFRSLVAEYPDNFVYLGRLGTVAARRGDVTTARQILERFDAFRNTLPMPHTSVGYWQSKISVLLGDEARAVTALSESIGPQGRWGMHADFDFERMWNSKVFRDFVRPKG